MRVCPEMSCSGALECFGGMGVWMNGENLNHTTEKMCNSHHISSSCSSSSSSSNSSSRPIQSLGGHAGQLSRDPPPVFSAGGHCEQFWHGLGCLAFSDVVYPTFPLLTITSTPPPPPPPKVSYRMVCGQTVAVRDMPEPCKVLSPEE